MGNAKKIKVLVAKPGLDGHDRGAKVVARALSEAGMEVIYTGLKQTPAMIAAAAAQEDVDVVGLSILSGAHNEILPEIVKELGKAGMEKTMVLAGGIIPGDDATELKAKGISEVFPPGTALKSIVEYIQERIS